MGVKTRKVNKIAAAAGPAGLDKEGLACAYWTDHLCPAGWKYFKPGRLEDWGFVPSQYVKSGMKIKQIQMKGKRGVHYALGWHELYEMIMRYGRFKGVSPDRGIPLMIDYKGPTLKCGTRSTRSQEGTDSKELKNLVLPNHHDFKVCVMPWERNRAQNICKLIPHEEWERQNPVPYRYLESVASDMKSILLIGTFGEKVISIFAFKYTGRGTFSTDCFTTSSSSHHHDKSDTTVLLLWTQSQYRKKGFSTRTMHEGIQYMVDGAYICSGTSTTQDSIQLFRGQNWQVIGNSFSAKLKELRKILEQKTQQHEQNNKSCRANTISTTTSSTTLHDTTEQDGDWEVKIGNDIIQVWTEQRHQQEVRVQRNAGVSSSSISFNPHSITTKENTNVMEENETRRIVPPAPSVTAPAPARQQELQQHGNNKELLLNFLQSNQVSQCLKVPPVAFHNLLMDDDITSLHDLREAVLEESYVEKDLRKFGLKGFKRSIFVRMVLQEPK